MKDGKLDQKKEWGTYFEGFDCTMLWYIGECGGMEEMKLERKKGV